MLLWARCCLIFLNQYSVLWALLLKLMMKETSALVICNAVYFCTNVCRSSFLFLQNNTIKRLVRCTMHSWARSIKSIYVFFALAIFGVVFFKYIFNITWCGDFLNICIHCRNFTWKIFGSAEARYCRNWATCNCGNNYGQGEYLLIKHSVSACAHAGMQSTYCCCIFYEGRVGSASYWYSEFCSGYFYYSTIFQPSLSLHSVFTKMHDLSFSNKSLLLLLIRSVKSYWAYGCRSIFWCLHNP